MILKEETTQQVINEIDKRDRRLNKGFWAGLLAFVIAKITHLLVTFAIGLWVAVGSDFEISQGGHAFIELVDNPVVGLIYLIVVTRMIYRRITK